MTKQLIGMHDWSPEWGQILRDAGVGGWCVTTHAIGCDPNDKRGEDFSEMLGYDIEPIARISHAYGNGHGCIPKESHHVDFAQRAANFVADTPTCRRFLLGNEVALLWESPYEGKHLTIEEYARCYNLVRQAVKAARPDAMLAPAPVAPWNAQIAPADWLVRHRRMLELCPPDWIALHAYTHGHDPALIKSDACMGKPYQHHFYHWAVYAQFIENTPFEYQDLEVHITEANADPFSDVNNGWICAAAQDVHEFNQCASAKVQSICLYRWPDHDPKFTISNKPALIEDFKQAIALRIPSPEPHPAVPTATPYAAYVNAEAGLNLRDSVPNGKVITIMPHGAKLGINGPDDGPGIWLHCEYKNGDSLWNGWAHSGYVTTEKPQPPEHKHFKIAEELAAQYGVDVNAVLAVIAIESGGEGFDSKGRLKLRFENHILNARWGRNDYRFSDYFMHSEVKPWEGHLACLDGQWVKFHGRQDLEHRVLDLAGQLAGDMAYECASMGLPQLMGFNHDVCGYPNAKAMHDAFSVSVEEQVIAMFEFIRRKGIIDALRDKQWVDFATTYNGSGQAEYYGGLLSQKYAQLRGHPPTRGAPCKHPRLLGRVTRAVRDDVTGNDPRWAIQEAVG